MASRKDNKKAKTKKKPGKTTSANNSDPCTAFYWFFREHSFRIADSMHLDVNSITVARQVQRVWKQQNALERRPYIFKAERVAALKNGMTSVTTNDGNEGNKKKSAAEAR